METKSNRKLSPSLILGLGLILATVVFAILLTTVNSSKTVNPPVLGTVASFSLTNQNGGLTTEASLAGKVWIADIIFTRCAGPCLRMSQQMQKLQADTAGDQDIQLVSLTTDPEFDSPEVLRKYGARFNADSDRWLFLTGTKKQIGDLATGSLKLTSVEKTAEIRENPEDLFIHSTIFVVVDKHFQLRGVFETEGDGVDPESSRRRILSLVQLLKEEK